MSAFLKERGLELSKEKTKITSIEEGFDFLGFNIRKYKNKLLIKPAKKGVKTFLTRIREIIAKTQKTDVLISILNLKIQGWANYYHHSVAKQTFAYIDANIFKALWRWAKRRHRKKAASWIKKKYYTQRKLRKWCFFATQEKGQKKKVLLLKAASDYSHY